MAVKKNLKPAVVKEVKHYTANLVKAGIRPESLIVFGSQVKGRSKPWSDIDVCVVSRQFGKDRYSERVRLMLLTDDSSDRIEPHPYHPKDLVDKWDPLAHEIRTTGVVV